MGGASASLVAQPAPTRLQAVLSAAEFARAGLTKLTPAELAALDAVLAEHQLLPQSTRKAPRPGRAALPASRATPAVEAQAFGAEQVVTTAPRDTPGELHSRIEGTLDEISGRAVFVLENGQVWQQRIPEAVHFPRKLVNPDVIVSRGLGGYKMVIVPANRVLFVKRIQ